MTTGFHWTYGVVEQASSTGAGASPLVGMSALNLGSTNPSGGGGGAGAALITMIPNGAAILGSEHTVKLTTSYSGNGGTISSVSITPSVATCSVQTSSVTFPLAAATALLSLAPIRLNSGVVEIVAPNPTVDVTRTAIPTIAMMGKLFMLKLC